MLVFDWKVIPCGIWIWNHYIPMYGATNISMMNAYNLCSYVQNASEAMDNNNLALKPKLLLKGQVDWSPWINISAQRYSTIIIICLNRLAFNPFPAKLLGCCKCRLLKHLVQCCCFFLEEFVRHLYVKPCRIICSRSTVSHGIYNMPIKTSDSSIHSW